MGLFFALWLPPPCRCRVSPVIWVEALRFRFDPDPLPMSVCSALMEVMIKASEACSYRGIMYHLCRHLKFHLEAARDHSLFLSCVHLRSSARLWCEIGWTWGSDWYISHFCLYMCRQAKSLPRFRCGLSRFRVFIHSLWEVREGSSQQCETLSALTVSMLSYELPLGLILKRNTFLTNGIANWIIIWTNEMP